MKKKVKEERKRVLIFQLMPDHPLYKRLKKYKADLEKSNGFDITYQKMIAFLLNEVEAKWRK